MRLMQSPTVFSIASSRAQSVLAWPRLKRGMGLLAFFAAYLVLDRVSYLEALRPFAVMAWNPGLGVCVAVVSIWGYRVLPAVFLAPILAAALIRGFPLTLVYTLCVGLLTVAKAALIVYGGRRLVEASAHMLLRNAQAAMLVATIPVTLLFSIVHAAGMVVAGVLGPQEFRDTAERLWIGDLIGVFVQMPFCLLLLTLPHRRLRVSWRWLVEGVLQALIVAVTVWFIFTAHSADSSDYFYLLFLPMIWIVLAHGIDGAIVLNMFVQGATVAYLLWAGPPANDLIFFQALAIVLIASSLSLGISVEQSRAATQRLQAREQEVAATLKVAATSELAGALAHELSHPIGAVSNYATALSHMIARGAPPDAPEVAGIVAKLRQESKRATDTVHRLREFFRSGSLAMEQVDLEDLLKDSVSLLSSRIGNRGIDIRVAVAQRPCAVVADRIQLHGVFHNLLMNAIEAMERTPVEARQIRVTISGYADRVEVAVEDSGPGVAPDIRDHIFEALATTKRDGLGLGLSMSRSILQAHGGRIACEASALGGARFVVSLPIENA